MNIVRRLEKSYVKEYLEDFMLNVADFGYGFIEIKMKEPGETTEIVIGIDEAKVQVSRKPGSRMTVASGVQIIKDGVATFYPDTNYNLWAYVVDTERNRSWLASEIRYGKYTIPDRKIREEIEDLAVELDFPTTAVESRDSAFDGYVRGNSQEEKDLLKEEIESLKGKLEKAKKPLDGRRSKRNRTGKGLSKISQKAANKSAENTEDKSEDKSEDNEE